MAASQRGLGRVRRPGREGERIGRGYDTERCGGKVGRHFRREGGGTSANKWGARGKKAVRQSAKEGEQREVEEEKQFRDAEM